MLFWDTITYRNLVWSWAFSPMHFTVLHLPFCADECCRILVVCIFNIDFLSPSQDLVKYTPDEHPDYEMLQTFMKRAQEFLENNYNDRRSIGVSHRKVVALAIYPFPADNLRK